MSGASWYRKFCESWGLTNKTNDFVDCVVEGFYTVELSKCSFQYMLESEVWRPDIKTAIFNANDHLERITIMTEGFPTSKFQKILRNVCKDFQKDPDIARKLEDRGRNFEVDLAYEKALRCYNLATVFAPEKSQIWGRVYAFRSGLFHTMKEYDYCLMDMKLALKNKCPDVLKPQMFDNESESIRAIIAGADDIIEPEILDMRNYRDEVLFKLDGKPNPKIPSAIDGLRMSKNEKKGRHLTSDRQFAPGTTVIVEEPYLSVLNETTKWETNHCSRCLVKIKRVFPCRGCVFVNYCSERCRIEDYNEGHDYECRCYPFFHVLRVSASNLLAFRAICKQGPENLYKRWQDSLSADTENEEDQDFIEGFDPKTGKYDSDSYHQLLHLKSHVSEDTLLAFTWLAVAVICTLDEQTTFFQESRKYDNQNFKNYVGSLYLHHSVSLPFNVVSLNEEINVETNWVEPGTPRGVHSLPSKEIITAIYPLVSIMCHSCDPTIFRQSLPNGKLAIITNREMNPGDEFQLSYGFGFLVEGFPGRCKRILERYRFLCQCDACVLEFPVYNDMDFSRVFLCPNCSDHFKESPVIQYKQCCLVKGPGLDDDGTCPNCLEVSNLSELIKEADKIQGIFEDADDLIMDGKCLEAIPILKNVISSLQALLCVPSKEIILAQVLLNEAHAIITRS